MKITINTSSFAVMDPRPLQILRAKGLEPVFNPYKRVLTADEVVALCIDVDGIIAGTESLNENVLSRLPKLKVVSRCGTGMNNVDLKAAAARSIKVFNTPGGPTAAVAELTIGLMLAMLRQVHVMDRAVRAGVWDKKMGNLLAGKTVGIVGFGRIGRKVAELLEPFGVHVIYVDPADALCCPSWKKVSMDQLLQEADIVTIHATVDNGQILFGATEFVRMKHGSWLLNLARGEAIDEEALVGALKNGQLSGAALDVFQREPYQGSLKTLDNVILTPHIGSYAAEARALMEIEAVENLLKGLGL